MKNCIKSFFGRTTFVLLLIFIVAGCDLFKLDVNTDPRNPASATPDLILPNVMVSASTTLSGGFNRNIHGFMGMMSSADDFNLTTASFSGTWTSLYPGPLKDLESIIKDPNSVKLPVYLGIAQVLKAYYFLNLVDLWGPVPYFDAFNGDNPANSNLNPKYDDPAAIYADLFKVLDAAIANLAVPSGVNYAAGDPIFGGDRSKWTKAAHSLKLKMLVQTRLVQSKFPAINYAAVINDILANSRFLTSSQENMEFRFNGALTPDYRHPWFTSSYTASVYGGSYLSHQYMFEMLENKDPRWPYYFKRQTATALNLKDATQRGTSPCSSIPGCQYGYIVYGAGGIDVLGRLNAAGVITGNTNSTLTKPDSTFLSGVFGRDRADNSGAPADGSLRTAFGAYPAGGIYDDNFPTSWPVSGNVSPTARLPVNNGSAAGVSGNGIFPMMTTTNVKFLIIEALLTIPGVTYTIAPDVLFETAIKEHIDRVGAVSQSVDSKAIAVSASNRDAYAAKWKVMFNNNGNVKLDILWKQGWFSAWGNAIDSYNAFRRTGYPATLQTPLNRIRQFPLSLPLAIDELTLNTNVPKDAPQFDTPAAALFWDMLKFKF